MTALSPIRKSRLQEDGDVPKAPRLEAAESINTSSRIHTWQDQALGQRREGDPEAWQPTTRQRLMTNEERVSYSVLDHI